MRSGFVEVEREMPTFVFHDPLKQFPEDGILCPPRQNGVGLQRAQFLNRPPCQVNGLKVTDNMANQGCAGLFNAFSQGPMTLNVISTRSIDRHTCGSKKLADGASMEKLFVRPATHEGDNLRISHGARP